MQISGKSNNKLNVETSMKQKISPLRIYINCFENPVRSPAQSSWPKLRSIEIFFR